MKTHIFKQHAEHTEWLNKLSFYKDETKIMQNRLEEVSRKNNSMEIRKEIEHFQNQFIIQSRTIETIKDHIAKEEKEISQSIKQNINSSDHRTAEDHSEERELVNGFENNFNLLRKEFNTFLGKHF